LQTILYLLHTRAWELIAGGLIWCMPAAQLSQRVRYGLTILGLALIASAIAALDKNAVWPGTWAALPVIGTSLVIWSQQRTALTHHPIAQWLGDRSYSLYLWHWPVFVTLVLLEQRYEPVALAAGIVMSILLGALSYRWIEQPTRASFSKLSRAQSWTSLISAGAVVSLAAIVVWKFSGFPARMPDAVEVAASEKNNKNQRSEDCHLRTGTIPKICEYGYQKKKILLAGDSTRKYWSHHWRRLCQTSTSLNSPTPAAHSLKECSAVQYPRKNFQMATIAKALISSCSRS
jgi:hypothetical protein